LAVPMRPTERKTTDLRYLILASAELNTTRRAFCRELIFRFQAC
jgi:hypothetical protein